MAFLSEFSSAPLESKDKGLVQSTNAAFSQLDQRQMKSPRQN